MRRVKRAVQVEGTDRAKRWPAVDDKGGKASRRIRGKEASTDTNATLLRRGRLGRDGIVANTILRLG